MGIIRIGGMCVLLLTLLSSARGMATEPNERYATRLYERLTGAPLLPNNPLYRRMVKLVVAGDRIAAAKLAMRDKRFYSVRLRNFAAPFTNVEESVQEPFNDLQALIIGVVRDDLDARLILTGNFRYQGYPGLFLPTVTRKNNDHYLEFERRGLDPWADLTRVNKQWEDLDEAAGAFTTRAWGSAHYKAGTNRRSFKHAFQAFLCATQESFKYITLSDDYVRRDVDRAPAGNPLTYQQHCRGCHTTMDAMGGAFARYDFKDETLVYLGKTAVGAKYNQNGETYPEGFVTVDDSWRNYLSSVAEGRFGWRGPQQGHGVAEFANLLANSQAYSSCLVTKVYREICGSAPKLEDAKLVKTLADQFETGGYKLASLFAAVATENQCVPYSGEETENLALADDTQTKTEALGHSISLAGPNVCPAKEMVR